MLENHANALAQFHELGCCVLPDFLTDAQILTLKARAAEIISEFDLSAHQHVFSTVDGRSDADEYFLSSGDKVRCFLEEGALTDSGELTCDRSHAFNKIGHALHELDPVFSEFSTSRTIAALAERLGLEKPQIWQSMYIFKPPGIGGEVAWHQDATYFYTTPITVTTLWFALDDASVENGCLWIDGNGADTPLRERFEVHDGVPQTRTCDPTPWPDLASARPIEVSAGTLVCFKGTLPHYSAPNRSDQPRHAYTLHLTDGTASYAQNNWLQREQPIELRS